jgi:hypothetical protein
MVVVTMSPGQMGNTDDPAPAALSTMEFDDALPVQL